MREPKYTSGDDFARPDINFNSDQRIIFMTGLGLPMRNQGEPFVRRFALLNHISYLALDFDAITAHQTEKENFGLDTAFDRAMDKISKLKEERLILVGPCFGGLMAYRSAQEFPKKVEGLVMTAPLLSTDETLTSHINSVLHARNKRLSAIGLDKELIKRMERFHGAVSLGLQKYGRISTDVSYQGPIHIIHGENDALVPVSNSFILQNFLSRSNVDVQTVPSGKHNFDVAHNNKMQFTISALKKHLGR